MLKALSGMAGLLVVGGLAMSCAVETADSESEQISQELPCEDCGGEGEGYEPRYPGDDYCSVGETRWNSLDDCDGNSPCDANVVGCPDDVLRCPLTGCGTLTNSPSTNPCYGKSLCASCILSNGTLGACVYGGWNYLGCTDKPAVYGC